MLIAVVYASLVFLYATISFSSGLQQALLSRRTFEREQAHWIAEAGVQKAVWCLSSDEAAGVCGGAAGLDYPGESFAFAGGSAATTVVGAGTEREIRSTAEFRASSQGIVTFARNVIETSITLAIQGGEQGTRIGNSAVISGDIHLNGSLWCGNTARIEGDVTLALGGEMDGCDVTGDVRARTIRNSEVGGDAFYQTISNTAVAGTLYPNSVDPEQTGYPIAQEMIDRWREEAEAGGVIAGDATLSATSSVIGPVLITGNLVIGSNADVTVRGIVYVEGTVTINIGARVSLDPSFLDRSGVILSGGNAHVYNNVVFNGSGTPGSFVLLMSLSPSQDPANPAIQLENNAENAVFYARNGLVYLSQNAMVNGVVGAGLELANNATAIYRTALSEATFISDPGFTYTQWDEVPGARSE